MSDTTPRRMAGTVLSVHRTSQGVVRYRWWPGRISVELLLLDDPAQILTLVRGVPGRRNHPIPDGTHVDDQRPGRADPG
jgi:hypothetical protein